jgi:RNA polymerase sigma-70 factor (ECF subfamily)
MSKAPGAQRDGFLETARARWPEIALDPNVYLAHIERHGARGEPSLAHAPDLYLACACAHGVASALRALDATLREDVARAVRRIDPSPAFVDEVTQVLRAKLLVGPAPKIAEYAGRSSLRAWIGVTATRAALNMRRNADDQGHDRIDSRVRAIAGSARASGETAYMKARYRPEFEEALRVALGRLDDDHRALLRLHFSEGVGLDKLAALYRVSRSTIARRVAAARRALLEDMQSELRAKLRLSEAELESLAAFVVSSIDVSVARLLEAPK